MAKVTVGTNTNMLNAVIGLMEGDTRPVTMSSTNYVVQSSAGYRGEFAGQGLTYKQGEWQGGHMHAMSVSYNGQNQVSITGASMAGDVDVWDRGYEDHPKGAASEIAYWLRESDTIIGSAGNEVLYGYGGDDFIQGGAGNDTIDGGRGIDTAVFSGARSAYQITGNGRFVSGIDGNDTLINIERLQFTDVTIALDIEGNAGQAYRLYQAAFNRTPDAGGLNYWVNKLDEGHSLYTIASAFTQSQEFIDLYGSSNPTAAVLIEKMYENVMHRASDAGGFNYWMTQLTTGMVDKNSLLMNFSESAENQANVIGVIQNGIELQLL